MVLNRKKDESVVVNGNVVVTVIDIRGDKVRLGFEAPQDVSVHRKEVWEAIQRQKSSENSEI